MPLSEARLGNPRVTNTNTLVTMCAFRPDEPPPLFYHFKCALTGRGPPSPLFFLSPRWNSSYGYCGEASLQMILLARGVWIGQAQARSLAECGTNDLILESRDSRTSCRFLLPVFGWLCCGVLWCAVVCCAVVWCAVLFCCVVGVCLWCYRGSE